MVTQQPDLNFSAIAKYDVKMAISYLIECIRELTKPHISVERIALIKEIFKVCDAVLSFQIDLGILILALLVRIF